MKSELMLFAVSFPASYFPWRITSICDNHLGSVVSEQSIHIDTCLIPNQNMCGLKVGNFKKGIGIYNKQSDIFYPNKIIQIMWDLFQGKGIVDEILKSSKGIGTLFGTSIMQSISFFEYQQATSGLM